MSMVIPRQMEDASALSFSGNLIVNFTITGIDGNLKDSASKNYKTEFLMPHLAGILATGAVLNWSHLCEGRWHL